MPRLYDPRWPHEVLTYQEATRERAIKKALQVRTVVMGDSHKNQPLDAALMLELAGIPVYSKRSLTSMARISPPDRHNATNPDLVITVRDPPLQWGDYAVRGSEEQERQTTRFLIGHEIAESFFFVRDLNGRIVSRPLPCQGGKIHRDKEYFCDVFAASLLFPPSHLPYDLEDSDRWGESRVRYADLSAKYDLPIETIRWCFEGLSKRYWLAREGQVCMDLPPDQIRDLHFTPVRALR